MKFANAVKTLTLVGVSALTLCAGASQADAGYGRNANPWLSGSEYQQAHRYPDFQDQRYFQEQRANLDQRQDRQLERILNGLESGRLTMREAVGLLREHQAIAALERQYLADGHLGPFELRDLGQRMDLAQQRIRFEKQDGERRYAGERHYR